jgi:hypothetical protein
MRRVVSRAVSLLVALLVVLSLAVTPTAAGAESRPDLPRLPRSCVVPPDLAPQVAMKCRLKPRIAGAPTIVLWGDSHAMQMIPALRQAIAGRRVNLVGFIFGACPPMDPRLETPEQRRAASECELTGHKAMRYIESSRRQGRRTRVVIGAAWQLYHHLQENGDVPFQGHSVAGLDRIGRLSATGTPRMFRSLSRMRVPTDVIGQSPFVPARPRPCPRGRHPYRCALPRSVVIAEESFNKARLRHWMGGLAGRPRLIETSNHFCTKKICQGVLDGVNTYADDGHVSATMARTLAPYFRRTVDAVATGS